MKETKSITINTGFLGLLTLLFIGLKLGHVIDWSWWWVFLPLWGSWAVIVIAFFVFACVAARANR